MNTLQVTKLQPAMTTQQFYAQQMASPVRTHFERPTVVRTAANINLLMLVVLATGMGVGLCGALCHDKDTMNGCIPFTILFAGLLWHMRNLSRRTRAAWTTQAGLAILGLWMFPLGTALSIIILASWFSYDTKEWFGCS